MKYFRILDDLNSDRWYLGDLQLKGDESVWSFVGTGEKESMSYIPKMEIVDTGKPVNFTFGEFDIIIVDEKTKQLFPQDEVQFFPVEIILTQGIHKPEKYYIMTIINEIDCLDKNLSSFDVYAKDDPIRPDLAGNYKTVYEMVIDKNKENKKSIFRLKNYNVAVIINEALKDKLEQASIKGIKYKEV